MSCFTPEHRRTVELLSNSDAAANPCAEDLSMVYVNASRIEWQQDAAFVAEMESMLAQSGLQVYLKQLEDEKSALAAKVCVFSLLKIVSLDLMLVLMVPFTEKEIMRLINKVHHPGFVVYIYFCAFYTWSFG